MLDIESLPKISVITVCCNSAATIEHTLQSVLSQTYPNIEYIIIDGGSTDGTLDIINRYRERIHRLISEPDRGVYDAMNKGVALATGDWVHLLNSDDHYTSDDALARAIPNLLPDRTNYFVLLREYAGVIGEACRFPYRGWKLYISAKLPHPAMIISREQYRKVGLYDTTLRIAADHDFILRMLKLYSAHFIDSPLVAMDQGGLSGRNLALTYREFMMVTIRHGMPGILAWGIYWLKRLRWGV
jgi:glycosyltransferase involved in cell wall biosynthesis